MDCEKFEPLLLDELYDELDELTSAAVKRHVSGCARCNSILNGMKATRRVVSLPLVPLPVGLEDRILAAAKEAQKVVPIKSRASRVLSIAGSWAMRPQTAMAAVFLLMIGTSAFLIRSKNYASKSGEVAVTVAGNPSPVMPAPQSGESLDDKAAAAAHGPTPPSNVTRPPQATAAASAVALADEANAPVDALTAGAARDKAKGGDNDGTSIASAFGDPNAANRAIGGGGNGAPITNAGPPAGAPGAYNEGYAQQAQTPPRTMTAQGRRGPAEKEAQDPFSLGAAAFRARNFAEATRQFDLAAQSGDANAALWAAESAREGQGCVVALGRFDQLAQKQGSSSWIGNEASLRAARCQIAMGQLDGARDRLNKLAQSSSHAQAAQTAMGELNVASRAKAGGASAGGAAAAPAKRAAAPAAPAAAPRSPSRAPNESAEKKDQINNSGF